MNQGERLKGLLKATGKEMGEIALLLGMTRQNLNYHLRKEVLDRNFHLLVKDRLKIDFPRETSEALVLQEKEDLFTDKPDIIFKRIPFYDINVSAGNLSFLDDGIIKGATPDDYMHIPKNIDADIAFPTFGHSMYPEISNGDKVAYKFIKDWSFFNYGMKYLIVTREQRMVKYLKKSPKKDFVILESRNKDYEPIDMPISSIKFLLQVRYIGKIEM